jgi:arylformamidase
MRKVALALGAGTVAMIGFSVATAQDRLPRECRQEIRQLCDGDRAQLRDCLREKAGELSGGCRGELRERLQARQGRDQADDRATARSRDASGGLEVAYGSASLQKADFWRGSGDKAPLVLFVHGGGWKRGDKQMMATSSMLPHWQAAGYAVASANYRLVPDATVEQQAADVAAAFAHFRGQASGMGIDPDRIVLIGHSAGAHLVALVGTDPKYLAAHNLKLSDIAGVLPNDGAAYDVPSQMGENAMLLGDTYAEAFGADPDRQAALSPTRHAAAPNAPDFLLIHVGRQDGVRQAKGLEAALKAAGTSVERREFAGQGCAATWRSTAGWAIPTTPPPQWWMPGSRGSSRVRGAGHPIVEGCTQLGRLEFRRAPRSEAAKAAPDLQFD